MGIHKINVTLGIQWVEIPEVNLRILCGCPADAVKHLIKRGLILPQEVKGVACETGPNAILLSDLMLQNGEFANLAEFPVLQMLYKQGLILPNHPNNTGSKPLLMGSAEQLDSQMRYIYRGNYGLVSCEEIMQAGIAPAQAAEMMRLKLKFAFGRIRPTRDFLDTRILEDHPLEITPGVSLCRLRPNVFQFSYAGDSVTVDLNLKPGEIYECAYPLGYRRFEPEYFAVIHSGEGDGWDIERPCMSSIITYQGRLYLIDAGPHITSTMTALGIGIDQVDGIFHTHAHDDHFAGLTTLMRAGRRIRYFATPLIRASVTKKLSALLGMEEESFADYFDIHDLTFDTWNDVEGLEVMPIFSPHPVETNIFVFRALWGDGYRSYAHFADIVSLDLLRNMVTSETTAPGLDQAAFERTRSNYLQTTDLKKIDIGGGMIHGNARDFNADNSKRILLAHRSGDLTLSEKEIGSSAAFGTVDVLVAGQSDVMRRHAFGYLETHLPGVQLHDLRMLINHPLIEINPGAIILKEGETSTEVLLVVTGRVEKIRTRDNLYGSLSAGALIGVGAMLDNRPSRYTYRASSFVRALRLPAALYATVIRRNGLLERMRSTADLRAFMDTTSLFGEGMPTGIFGQLVDCASEKHFQAGQTIGYPDLQVLNLIRCGRIERSICGNIMDILEPCDFFGEEGAIFNVPYLTLLRVIEPTTVIQIPGKLLGEVPILRWRLFESYQQRVTRTLYDDSQSLGLIWNDSFSINIAQMDRQHKRLIEIANAIMAHLDPQADFDSLIHAFDSLIAYARYHFTAEENLMALYGYPGASMHSRKHAELFLQVNQYQLMLTDGNRPDKPGFLNFFKAWLLHHIFEEDRKYGTFLNAKGVY